MSATPVAGQSLGLVEVGSEALALRHGLEALVRTLSKEQRVEFGQHLRSHQPKHPNAAYVAVQASLIRASQ
ncbi:hypothetical protein SE336_15960 [Xanthomonas arboricola]|uniref:hypothetical protein n=1 Tax=Xanthomonas arboricola TaxID=56448 RepID=UPI0039F4F7A0